MQDLSQDLETGCLKLTVKKIFWVSSFSRETKIYSDYYHKHALTGITDLFNVMGIILR